MSNKIFPMPVGTPFSERSTPSQFTLPWSIYFKALGDDLLAANIAYNLPANNNFKYVLNGNACFCTYYTQSPSINPISLQLPYQASLAFDINGVVYTPSSTYITIPANASYLHFWYIVNFTPANPTV